MYMAFEKCGTYYIIYFFQGLGHGQSKYGFFKKVNFFLPTVVAIPSRNDPIETIESLLIITVT
jgi:hypothetical protein